MSMPGPENVLVVRVGQLGDTLVAIPAMREARRQNPGRRMILLTNWHPSSGFISSWDVLKGTGILDEVIFYNFERHSLWSMISLAFQLRTRRFVCLYYLMPTRRSRQRLRDKLLFRYLLGIRRTFGLDACEPERRDRAGRLARLEPE